MKRLGPYEIDSVLGEGAGGTVYQARHDQHGLAVAIKAIDAAALTHAAAIEDFELEVGSLASLSHPHIVEVFDRGVDPSTGTPWLAMELCSGGTLTSLGRTFDWPSTRGLLVDLLDALAHAHARGLVHRDLKPANLLLSTSRDARPGWKLSDFGIALPRAGGRRIVAGTPQYMAPEQWEQDSTELGPWTDLYAIGCLATKLVTGRTPFQGKEGRDIALAHWTERVPDLKPRFAVPVGLDGWIKRLLAKSPCDRPQLAADARWSLIGLEETFTTGPTARVPWEAEDALMVPTEDARTLLQLQPVSREQSKERPTPAPICPPPKRWRLPPARPLPLQHHGAGLTLLPYRQPPLVGRDQEAGWLWERLLGVHTTGRMDTVRIVGEQGAGSTALSQWFGHRAMETGAAWSVYLDGRNAEPVRTALTVLTRVDDLGFDESQSQATAALRAMGAATEAAIEALALAGSSTTRDATHTALRVVLRELAIRRPVLVVADHTWCSTDLHDFATHLAATAALESPRPLLVVCVGRHDDGSQPDLVLEPMQPLVMESLISSVLPVDRRLAGKLSERAGGRPAVAVHELRRLGQGGHLRLGKHGFYVVGQLPSLPDRETDNRLERFLRTASPTRLRWLERAAAANALNADDLAHFPDGWREPTWMVHTAHRAVFRDPRVATTLRHASSERLQGHHRWWLARMKSDAPAVRRGEHLLGAGRLDEVLDLWHRHLPAYRLHTSAATALALTERLLLATRRKQTDPYLTNSVRVYRCRFLRQHAEANVFRKEANRVLSSLEEWPDLLARLHLELGQSFSGTRAGDQHFHRAADAATDPITRAEIARRQGESEYWRNPESGWSRYFDHALELLAGDPDSAEHWITEATYASMTNDKARLRRALEGFEPYTDAIAYRMKWLGWHAALQDDRTRCLEAYAELATCAAVLGDTWHQVHARLNMAHASLMLGAPERAAAVLRGPPDCFDHPELAWGAHLIAVGITSAMGRWEAFDEHFQTVAAHPERLTRDPEAQEVARFAAERCETARPRLARRLRAWARPS